MPTRHSALGVASFIISIAVVILIGCTCILAGVAEANTYGGLDDDTYAVVGVVIVFSLLGDLVALGLGIWGTCMQNTNKLFAILGTCFSGGTILGTLFLMLIGFASGA